MGDGALAGMVVGGVRSSGNIGEAAMHAIAHTAPASALSIGVKIASLRGSPQRADIEKILPPIF
jgi:hypothetical protein